MLKVPTYIAARFYSCRGANAANSTAFAHVGHRFVEYRHVVSEQPEH
jgi:hypothetical protein